MRYYKFYFSDNASPHAYHTPDEEYFPTFLNGTWIPGKEFPEEKDIFMCTRGWHFVDEEHLLEWMYKNMYEVEIPADAIVINKGLYSDQFEKYVASKIRLIRKVEPLTREKGEKIIIDVLKKAIEKAGDSSLTELLTEVLQWAKEGLLPHGYIAATNEYHYIVMAYKTFSQENIDINWSVASFCFAIKREVTTFSEKEICQIILKHMGEK